MNQTFRELENGEYVLFLEPWTQKQGYRVLWGNDGVFDVGASEVKPRGGSLVSRMNELKARDQFLIELRQAAKRAPR